jgi:hypothetical protein
MFPKTSIKTDVTNLKVTLANLPSTINLIWSQAMKTLLKFLNQTKKDWITTVPKDKSTTSFKTTSSKTLIPSITIKQN